MAITFKIAARALRHLGAELITSEEMALNELMKNSFDAGSPRVKIEINYPVNLLILEKNLSDFSKKIITKSNVLANLLENSKNYYENSNSFELFSDYLSPLLDNINSTNIDDILCDLKKKYYIKITDTGHGMSKEDLENVFMTIGINSKLNVEKNEDRILLGEKGIGRLSMMKLGNFATVKSKKITDTKGHQIIFDWLLFENPNLYLDEIGVTSEETNLEIEKGTQIFISDLNSDWSLLKTKKFVKEYIQRLKSPFNHNPKDFPIDIYQNGNRIPIEVIPHWLTNAANFEANYTFTPTIEDHDFSLKGLIKWSEASLSDDQRSWTLSEIIHKLDTSKQERDQKSNDYIEIINKKEQIIPKSENYKKIKNELEKLGPITIKVFWFNRNDFKKTIGYKPNWKKELDFWVGGFAIYRDGFRIGFTGGLNDDWLAMDRKALKSTGYTFNRYQTIGIIEISKLTNPYLKDSANRQTLIENTEFFLLKDLMTDIVIDDIKFRINNNKTLQEKIDRSILIENIDNADISYINATKSLNDIKQNLPADKKAVLDNVEFAMKNQHELISTLRAEIDDIIEKNTDILELAGLGQMVDFIGHELSRITKNTSNLLNDLKFTHSNNNDYQIGHIIDELQKQIDATKKRIASIDVHSPANRQRPENYNIVNQISTILELYESKFKRHHINVYFTVDDSEPKSPIMVKMVRGLIAQIIENLLTNSVHWLDQGIKLGDKERKIEIDVDSKAKTISIRDNGPGIAPEHIHEVFKAYFTNRPNGKGLGLYIASEVAAHQKSKLYLLNDLESDNRLRTFILELPFEN
ncbi:sensor histidine kinase [Acinetobacter pragensis]|uniref:Histidine kinase domain-containing protein n=1 Tax=Acinetobacter pragensis TaxID=1806892 RepID=A0A151Y0B2_9GAMM|nr:sensor histidine kinase [Acinetobacter pragensis]KYQ71476.1 hypothetical protein AZH43_14090 [Acinetobacter pragensis]